jgi:glycosyltransferase involved in cell wall biosynthesis
MPVPLTESPRRIVVVSHSREVGGAEVYLENLFRYLTHEAKDRWQPELILRRDAGVDSLAASVAEWAPVERLDFGRPSDLSRIASRLRGASLVHLNLSFPTGKYPFGVALLARALGRPLLVTHHLALRVGPPWRQLMRWMGRNAQHISVSRHSASVLAIDYGYSLERIEVIHNGVDPELFHPATPDERSRLRRTAGERYGGEPWDDQVLLACTVARLSRQKGLFDLVEAAAELVKDSPNLKMVIIGEGELRRTLRERINALGLQDQLILAGAMPRPQVAEWLAACDLFVLPSRYEGGPATALMEAMACACAVVATDVSGTSELVTDDSLGLLVPPQDPRALAAAIRTLMADANLRTSLAGRAREKVLAEFTVEACMRRTEDVLEKVLSQGRLPSPLA